MKKYKIQFLLPILLLTLMSVCVAEHDVKHDIFVCPKQALDGHKAAETLCPNACASVQLEEYGQTIPLIWTKSWTHDRNDIHAKYCHKKLGISSVCKCAIKPKFWEKDEL